MNGFRFIFPLAFAAMAMLTGCGPTAAELQAGRGVSAYFASDFHYAVRALQPVADTKDENYVLNNCRLGSAALAEYDLTEAQDAFLRAYEVINSVGVNDGGRTLGAVLVDEKLRIWKGEPYERAMVNFYLGLIYYIQRDYNNARAAFENALFKLRDYSSDDGRSDDYRRVESDFALGYLMLGKCHQRLGHADLARTNFDRAVQLSAWLAPSADYRMNEESNLLLVVDFGRGPRKFTSPDGAVVGLGPAPWQEGPVPLPQVIVDGKIVRLNGAERPAVDTLALGQDRRWQSIDTIRAVKSIVGTGLIAAGAIDSSNRDRRNRNDALDLALIGAGLFLKATSQADVRQWEMLPRSVFVLPIKLPPGRHDVTLRFPAVPSITQTWRGLVVPEQGEATYYMHLQPYNAGPFEWPPPAMSTANVNSP